MSQHRNSIMDPHTGIKHLHSHVAFSFLKNPTSDRERGLSQAYLPSVRSTIPHSKLVFPKHVSPEYLLKQSFSIKVDNEFLGESSNYRTRSLKLYGNLFKYPRHEDENDFIAIHISTARLIKGGVTHLYLFPPHFLSLALQGQSHI